MLAFQMRSLAIGWHIYATTQSPLDLGWVGLAQFLPMLVLSPFAGQIVDRVDRKRVLQWTLVIDGAISGVLFWLAYSHPGSVKGVYPCLILAGAIRPFAATSGQSLLPSIVSTEIFPRAVAWSATTWQIATVLGPVLGGVVYALMGPDWVYLTCALLTGGSGCLLTQVVNRPQHFEKGPVSLESYLTGLRFVMKNRIILGAISLDLFAVLLGGAVALLPIFAKDILNVGPAGLGLLRAAPGTGAVITGIILARYPIKHHTGTIMLACVGIFGIFTIGFGLSTHFYISLFCLFCLGAADLVSVIIRSVMVQMMTPDSMRGRVSAINFLFIGTSNELGEFESGITAAWWGTVPAVVIGGLGTLFVVFFWNRIFPEFRKCDRLEPVGDLA